MASACGKDATRLVRRVSNSEYLSHASVPHQIHRWATVPRSIGQDLPLPNFQTPTLKRLDRAMPHHIRADARRSGDDDELIDGRALGPAGLCLHVVFLGVVFELDGWAGAVLRDGVVAQRAGRGTGGPEGRRG